MNENILADWLKKAEKFEEALKLAVIGQERAIHLITIAIFSRGHVLLKGDVGVGKTTLLRSVARAIGGAYERVEGSVDLMPTDMIYYTYIGEDGKPKVDPGPVLRHGDSLSTFFFNEINRARPQVHSLLLRVMAERSVNAFNKEFEFPHLQVFADRNRIEREETFEISSAAKDRFLMEISIETPNITNVQKSLIFDSKFHNVDDLINTIPKSVLPYKDLNKIGSLIQKSVEASDEMKNYAVRVWKALRDPSSLQIKIEGVDSNRLVEAGASPRGMSMLIRAAKVNAWLAGRLKLIPEDLHGGLNETMGHRIFLYPNYELMRDEIVEELLAACKNKVPAP
ncbi:MAG: AAA family ATPase [Betaproteobacteria bacterium TMED156]|nr:MAG: AAA family ATPase [Betaproteobacteria bacterium TMED156]